MKLFADSRYKLQVIARDGVGCQRCPEWRLSELSVDHKQPIAARGSIRVGNLQLLCFKCHIEKDKDVGARYSGGRKKFKKIAWNWKGNTRPKLT